MVPEVISYLLADAHLLSTLKYCKHVLHNITDNSKFNNAWINILQTNTIIVNLFPLKGLFVDYLTQKKNNLPL